MWNFSALIDEATGHRRNAAIRAGGHLGGHLGFAKIVLGASAGPRGLPRKGKTLRLRSFTLRSSRKTERLHIYNGFGVPEASYPVEMQRFEPSHGTP